MIKFLSDDEKKLRNAPRRYGTHISKLRPEDIKCVGYVDGSFYVSEYEWKDFSGVLRDASWELTWIGNVGWFAYEAHKCVYEWLAARYDLTGFCNGEWILLDEWRHGEMTPEQMEIARLQRENDDLKRENKRLGEIKYILQISNIAQNALARCVSVTDIEARGIARRAQKDIKKVNEEWRKWYPVDIDALPKVETY